jgi:SAM-dependent methyltransferase
MQPICNRFLANAVDEEYKHPLVIGQCGACGVIQISDPVPASELRPRYDWITYNEPEGHLSDLVEIICNLPGVMRESVICGISYKEDSTLTRLNQKGFMRTWRIDPKDDLGISDLRAGIETIQDHLHPDISYTLTQKHGASDVVIVRHILEHAHDTLSFMESIGRLVNPGGYVVFEVPDCTQALETLDCTTVWEEHILYFTPETFRHCFTFGGFSLVHFECYPYAYENSLVGIAQPKRDAKPSFPSGSILDSEKLRARVFAEDLARQRSNLRRFFSEYRQNHGRIAVFGAGHLACTFINLMGLKDQIDFAVDDNPNKQGLFMPGSRLPIYGSAALIKENIKLCLMSLSPESEDKVIQKSQAFLEQGGVFGSIFPGSKRALRI